MDPAKKEIRIIHAIHPSGQEFFRDVATPREVVKANKSTAQIQCTTCYTPQTRIRACKRCKSAWYCSEACQKKDWPRHKAWCSPSERRKGIQKLVENFICNVTLSYMLQVCVALDLDLNNDKKKEIGYKYPFMIRVDIAIEPSDVHSFVKLLLTDDPAPEKIEGMVQVNRFFSHIPGRSGYPPLTEMRETMWRRERERLNGIPECRSTCFGLVEFVNNDSDFSVTSLLPVLDGSMKLAKDKGPFTMTSAFTGAVTEKPLTVASQMEFINTHIRSDKKNELRLRTEMTDTDKAIVRSVRDKSVTRDAVVALRQKIARESIYASIRQRL